MIKADRHTALLPFQGISDQLAVLEAGYGGNRDTGSLRSVYRRGRGAAALDAYRQALLPALSDSRAVGFLVFRGDELLGGDVFATHALLARSAPRYLAGFVLEERGIARAGHPIALEGEEVGLVTSGVPSPTLGKSIGLGYVPPTLAAVGSRFDVMVRGRRIRAKVVETPFIRA